MNWLKCFTRASRNKCTARPARLLMALEPRMMFDGAIAASVAEASEAAPSTDASDSQAQSDATALVDQGTDSRREVVFIDNRLADLDSLLAAIRPGVEVVLLDGQRDGLAQMLDWAQQQQGGYDAIHLLTHSSDGTLQLGSLRLDLASAEARQADLAQLGSVLKPDGDLLLYGCDLAAGEAGLELIRTLAHSTGADIAASSDATGSLALGGNWDLEYQHGAVEADIVVDADRLADSAFLLALPSNGRKDVTEGMAHGAFIPGFTLEANGSIEGHSDISDISGISDGLYLYNLSGPGYFQVNADNVNLGSFNLTGISILKYDTLDHYTITIIGYKLGGGEVITNIFTYDGSQTYTGGDFSAFTGITGFRIVMPVVSGGDYTHLFDSFTISGATAPAMPPSLVATPTNPTFFEGGAAVDLFNGVTALVNDAGQTFTGMTLTVSNVIANASEFLNIGGTEIVLVNGHTGSIPGIGSYSVSIASGTASVTLSGMSRSDAQMGALIDGITYRNSSNDPSATRTVTITQIVDSGIGSNSAVPNLSSTITLAPVNDAPTLSATGLTTTYTENASAVDLFSGVSISTVEAGQTITGLTLTVANLADGASEILRIDGTDITLTNGFFTTTASNGMNVSVSLVGSTATVTLSKAGGISVANTQTLVDGISYRNSSESPTTSGNRVITLASLTDSGGTANGGVDTASLSITATVSVVAVNDAPTLSGGPYALTGTDEDTASNGTLISTILAGLTHGDVDAGALSGIALIATTGNGTWQYSTDGVSWSNVGTVSGNAALLLSGSSQLRYVPDGANGETATLTFRAWDQTSGSASTNSIRNTADATTNGGTTAFSTGTAQASLTVSAVNDAPVLAPIAPTLTGLIDSDTNNAGQTVASIVGASISDVDSGALQGIAITDLSDSTGSGTWQYSLDGGTNWTDMGAVSVNSALLLRATDLVRFVPDGVSGTTASLTYHAWDRTSGSPGEKVDASSSGGSTAFSSASDTASLTVTAVDDPATMTTSGGTTAFTESANSDSAAVAIDPNLTLSDSDSPTLASATVSLTGNFQAGQDLLGFTNDGVSMGNIAASYNAATGVLTLTSAGATATLAQWQAALRSVTYDNSSDTPNTATRTVSFVVSDGNTDSNAATKLLSVTAVNDAPQVIVPSSITVTEDTASALTGISFSDADAGSAIVTATFSVGSGSLSATSAYGVVVGGTASALTLTGSIASINAFIDVGRLTFTTETNASADVTLTVSIDDDGNSGSGGAKTASDTITLQVSAVNDAPVISAPASIDVNEDQITPLTDISFADVDAGNASLTATLSVGSGSLTATDASGVVVAGSGSTSLTLTGSLADLNAFLAAGQVSFQTALDATSNVVLTVQLDDNGNTGSGGAKTDTTTVTLAVTAVNDAPINNLPAAQSVDQDSVLVFSAGNGNLISISDVDAGGGNVRVTLTATNGLLTLGGTTGLTFTTGDGTADAVLTFEGTLADINLALNGMSFSPTAGYNGPASLQITTDDLGHSGDGGSQTDTDTLVITVNSLNPVVTSVSVTAPDGTYKVGDVITVTVSFDQAVTVNTAGGSPTLLLETGSVDRQATYVSGSGSNTLTFSYTVQAGDLSADLDYHSSGALALNGATIRNVTADDAVLALPTPGTANSIAGQHDVVIDGVAPTVSSVSVPAAGTYVAGQHLDFTVNFSEAVIVDSSGGTPRIAVTLNNGGTVYANYLAGSGSGALVFRLTVASGQLDGDGITLGSNIQPNGGTLRDAVGNDAATALNGVSPTDAVLVDAVAPQIVSLVADQPSPSAGPTLAYTLTFDEPVQGVDIGDFSLVTSGSVSATVQSVVQLSPTSYRILIEQISGSGTLTLQLSGASGITDLYGNALTGALPPLTHTIGDLSGGDPEWLVSSTPLPNASAPTEKPDVPVISGDSGGRPTATPLFEPRGSGGDLPSLAEVFTPPSGSTFIAQVFSEAGGAGQGAFGFLGFGGSDANVFDRSEIARTFGQRGDGELPRQSAAFGAPTLQNQLREIDARQARALDSLTTALGQLVADGSGAPAKHLEITTTEPNKGAAQG